MKGVTWPRNTRQTDDEFSPEPIEENEGIDKVENPPRIEHSMLASPAPFNVDAADFYYEWKHWVNTFDICALATELTKKDDPIQRATHLHCLGTSVQRIFTTLPSDHETLDEDKEALENYFAPKKNVVSERHKIRSDPIRSDPIWRTNARGDDRYLSHCPKRIKSKGFINILCSISLIALWTTLVYLYTTTFSYFA